MMISGAPRSKQALQPVVAVDDPAVEVVEVRGREPATVELDHRAQVRRDHRHRVEDHAHRAVHRVVVVVAAVERRDDLQALDRLGLALALGGRDDLLEQHLFLAEVETTDEALDRLGAHAALEVVTEAVAQLAPDALVVDELLRLEGADAVVDRLQEVELELRTLAQLLDVTVRRLAGPVEVGLLGAALFRGRELGLELLEALLDVAVAALLLLGHLGPDVGLDGGKVGVQLVCVDPRDQVRREVDDLLEALRRDVEEVPEPARDPLEVPDVRDRGGQLDVAHSLTTHLRAGDLDATALADDSLEADALVLAAVALPVLGRTEDLLAEQAVLLGLERAVVDRLRLLDLAVGPGADLVGGGQGDGEPCGVVDVEHSMPRLSLVEQVVIRACVRRVSVVVRR